MGLIPACAGKTSPVELELVGKPAHPRVCGENLLFHDKPGGVWGSSPRVRGKHGHPGYREACQRLIPACAGKTPVA